MIPEPTSYVELPCEHCLVTGYLDDGECPYCWGEGYVWDSPVLP